MKLKGKGPKGKDINTFVRFGGLDLKTQKGYKSEGDKTFHQPPAPRGFYAFPKVAQELFLIGSLDKFQPSVLPKSPEYPGEDASPDKILKWNEIDWNELNKRSRKIKSDIRKEFRKTTGTIWHHFVDSVPNSEVIDRNGSWVKTTMSTWEKAFNKESLKNRYGEGFGDKTGRGEQSINSTRGITGYYSKDHFEVFFDEKV